MLIKLLLLAFQVWLDDRHIVNEPIVFCLHRSLAGKVTIGAQSAMAGLREAVPGPWPRISSAKALSLASRAPSKQMGWGQRSFSGDMSDGLLGFTL